MKKEITYISECGCRLSQSQTSTIKGTKIKGCKYSESKIVSAERECEDCDIILLLTTGSDGRFRGKFRCPPHQCKHKKEMRRVENKKAKEKSQTHTKKHDNRKKHDPRGDYCAGLAHCILLKKVSCSGCKKFIPIFGSIDPEKRGIWKQ